MFFYVQVMNEAPRSDLVLLKVTNETPRSGLLLLKVRDEAPRLDLLLLKLGTIELQIPPGTQPGDVLVLAKKGAPKLNRPSIRGDHLFTIKVTVPQRIRRYRVISVFNAINITAG